MAGSNSMSSAQSAPVTWDEFVELEEDDLRELVDGVLVEVEVPDLLHENAVSVLNQRLRNWADAAHAGLVLASGYKVRITDRRGVMPDVQFIAKQRIELADRKGFTRGMPDLVVEVVSPSSGRYDRVVKLGWYATAGVREYWIVDPEDRTLERLVLESGRYVIAASLADDAVFEPESFPGLSIPLAELWISPTPSG